jgi:hypothetical protein
MGSGKSLPRLARCATLAFLVMSMGSREATAQGMACLPVRSGDTAAALAWRLSGDASNTRQPWFQILNPATGRFVSKSTYDRILVGWQACLAGVRGGVSAPGTSAARPAAGWLHAVLDSNVVLWGLLVVLIAFIVHSGDEYLRERKAMLVAMRRFAAAFVREFETPLIDPGAAERPIRSQVRFAPHRARLEVLLAPNGRRRYPNLADHRTNVEYDVTRVLRRLNDQSFLSGPPYVQRGWVVVPFQRTVGSPRGEAAPKPRCDRDPVFSSDI